MSCGRFRTGSACWCGAEIIDTIPVEQASNERLSMLMAGIGPDYVAASLRAAPVESIAVDD